MPRNPPRPSSVKCPKCWAPSSLTWEATRHINQFDTDDPPDLTKEPLVVEDDVLVSAFYRCSTHGEFGFCNDDVERAFFIDSEFRIRDASGRVRPWRPR